mgnify:CR=1 FL=1
MVNYHNCQHDVMMLQGPKVEIRKKGEKIDKHINVNMYYTNTLI